MKLLILKNRTKSTKSVTAVLTGAARGTNQPQGTQRRFEYSDNIVY